MNDDYYDDAEIYQAKELINDAKYWEITNTKNNNDCNLEGHFKLSIHQIENSAYLTNVILYFSWGRLDKVDLGKNAEMCLHNNKDLNALRELIDILQTFELFKNK